MTIARTITDDFKRRVPTIKLITPPPGASYYALIHAEYVENGADRFGPDHHILVDVWGEDGSREFNTPVNFTLPDKKVETRFIDKVGAPYGADLPLFNHGHVVGCWAGTFYAHSDYVDGMGLGKIGSEFMDEHVTYFLIFQRQAGAIAPSPIPITMTGREHIQKAIRHLEAALKVMP